MDRSFTNSTSDHMAGCCTATINSVPPADHCRRQLSFDPYLGFGHRSHGDGDRRDSSEVQTADGNPSSPASVTMLGESSNPTRHAERTIAAIASIRAGPNLSRNLSGESPTKAPSSRRTLRLPSHYDCRTTSTGSFSTPARPDSCAYFERDDRNAREPGGKGRPVTITGPGARITMLDVGFVLGAPGAARSRSTTSTVSADAVQDQASRRAANVRRAGHPRSRASAAGRLGTFPRSGRPDRVSIGRFRALRLRTLRRLLLQMAWDGAGPASAR